MAADPSHATDGPRPADGQRLFGNADLSGARDCPGAGGAGQSSHIAAAAFPAGGTGGTRGGDGYSQSLGPDLDDAGEPGPGGTHDPHLSAAPGVLLSGDLVGRGRLGRGTISVAIRATRLCHHPLVDWLPGPDHRRRTAGAEPSVAVAAACPASVHAGHGAIGYSHAADVAPL